MTPQKSKPTSFRLSQEMLTALREAAEKEHRSQANMLEVMVRAYCAQHGVEVMGRQTALDGKDEK